MSADWNKIKTEYITTNTSYRKLADKYGIDQATISRKGKKEDWVSERQRHIGETQAKILAADVDDKVDRATKLMTVADKLLRKVEMYVEGDGLISPTSAKNLSDALKNIKEVCMVRTLEDIEEQKARIANLQKQAQKDEDSKDVRVEMDEEVVSYSG